MGTDIENLQTLLKQDPSNFQARRELAVMLAYKGFNEEALVNLEFLEKYFPEDADLMYNLGILHEKLNNLIKAKEYYEKAIAISPQEDFYYNLGEVLVELKAWDEAISVFNKVLETDSNDGNCYFNLGYCYFSKGEKNLAIDNFQKAVSLNPKDLYAYFYLGYIYQKDGLTNFAIENYKNVLAISPDYSWAYYNLASISYQNKNLDEAKDYLLKTIQYNKNDIEAYKLITKICLQQNETEEIITVLETRLADENGDIYYLLAQVYKYISNTANYIEALQNALKCSLTLTYSHKDVKKELIKIKKTNPEDIDLNEHDYSEYSEVESVNNEEDTDTDSENDENYEDDEESEEVEDESDDKDEESESDDDEYDDSEDDINEYEEESEDSENNG